MNNMPDLIYFKDRESRFIKFNKAFMKYFGQDNILGKTDFDFFTEKHAQQAFRDEQEIIKPGKSIINKIEKETWEGREDSWVSSTKVPLYDDNGTITGIIGISRNISKQLKNIESRRKSEELLNFAIQQTTIPVIIVSAPDKQIISINATGKKMLIRNPEKLTENHSIKDIKFWSALYPNGNAYQLSGLPLMQAVNSNKITRNV